MARPRTPWWMYALAASILAYLGLMIYAEVFGPGPLSLGLRFREGRVLVVEVVPDYPAARAGIESGDRIVAVDGQPTKTLREWRIAAENVEVGRPSVLELERDGQRREVPVSFDPHWRHWGVGTWLTLVAKVIAELVTFTLALVFAFRRPHEPVALVGAFWLAALSITDLAPIAVADPHVPSLPPGASAVWRSVPAWLTPSS